MAKDDSQLGELKNLLPGAKNILIALPVGSDIDKFAAGLALFLALEQSGKQVSVVSDDTVKVSQAHLFGVDHIQKNLPSTEGGNLIITLEGVATPEGTVPALQNLDWYPENNNLNLVFHTVPGQAFQPSKIVPHYQGSGFNLIFTIGATDLNSLGSLYSANQQAFSGVHIVDINNQPSVGFGATNIIDSSSVSLSEMVVDLIPSLGLPFDGDEASNLLAGIFEATNNLSSAQVRADTFMAVATCLRAGGKKPSVPNSSPVTEQPQGGGLDLSKLIPSNAADFTVPPVVNQTNSPTALTPSPEERPNMETASSESIEVEPGWLTPKVFKGSSAG